LTAFLEGLSRRDEQPAEAESTIEPEMPDWFALMSSAAIDEIAPGVQCVHAL